MRTLIRWAVVLGSLMVCGGLGSSTAHAIASPLAVDRMTVNGRVDPLGISGQAPSLGWSLRSDERGAKQSGYEVEVSTAPEGPALWSTGKITSDKQVDVRYEGPALASGTRYQWRVRVWDGDGIASAWRAAWFETGLLAVQDWAGAEWIGKATPSDDEWTDYTVKVDFQLRSLAFGTFLRARDASNAYMWQLNVGTSASSVPQLVRHTRVNGTYAVNGAVDLRPFGFTRAGLLAGSHTVRYALTGSTIRTTLDGVLVDTYTSSTFAKGRIGFRTWGNPNEAVTISDVVVSKDDGAVLADPGLTGVNPFSGGTIVDGALLVSGTIDALLTGSDPNAPLLRKEFRTDEGKQIASARVYASAHGVYELSLNGRRIGDQYLAPGYTEYTSRIQSQSYDVTDLVRAGGNALGAALGDGWWAGKVGLEGKHQYGTDLALVARLRVTYRDGSVQWVDTDRTWRWDSGPFVATDNQLGETYDARFEQAGWNTSGFDDRSWKSVAVRPSDTRKLVPQPDEPVRETQVLDPIKVTSPVTGVRIYDLGQNMVGVARVTLTGRAGETVKLRHAEVLNRDGTMYVANLRGAVSTDYYTFAKDGTVTYQPTFTQHGFRYIEITGLSQPPSAADVKGVVWGSDLPATGTLGTSNAMLNQLTSNISWGQRGNFLSIPTDTPARDERLGWTGDIGIFAPTAAYLRDTRAFLGKWMDDVRDEQKPNGDIPAVIPSTNGAFNDGSVWWSDAIISVPYSTWHAYGDSTVIRSNYAAMRRFFEYARTTAGPDLLETGRLTFFSGDWLHLDDPSNQGVIGTAAFAQDARMMAEMAAALGQSADAAEYGTLYEAIRRAFTAAYVAADGTVAGNSQTGYALALGIGLITDPVRQQRAGEKYVAKLALADNHLRTGFVGTPWLLPALTNIGRDDLAYTLLLKEDYPSWGYEIAKGATTVWERWNSIQPDGSFGPVDMNSFNHYAYGAVADWMHQRIGGLGILEPGYKKSLIEPRLGGGLTHAEGTLRTVYGTLANRWAKTADGFTMEVTVPVNTTAVVRIPSASQWSVTESGRPLRSAAGVGQVTYRNGMTSVEVGSGTYRFEALDALAPIGEVVQAIASLRDDLAGLDLSDASRAKLSGSLRTAQASAEAALTGAQVASLSAALNETRGLLNWIAGSDVPPATANVLRSRLQALVGRLQARLAHALGLRVSVAAPAGPVEPGSAVQATLTIANTGTEALRTVTVDVEVDGLTGGVSTEAVGPGVSRDLTVAVPVPKHAKQGALDAIAHVRVATASAPLSYDIELKDWVIVDARVTITDVAASYPLPGLAKLSVTVDNAGTNPVSGRVRVGVPADWRPAAPSSMANLAPRSTAVIDALVYLPLGAEGGAYPVSADFVDRGVRLASRSAQVTIPAMTVPPTEPTTDHVDFGNSASELAHGVQASPTSGTSSEAGFTRRYSHNNTPGSWYSANVSVPAGKPFLLRLRETWNSAGTKDYDVSVDGSVVKHVRLVRTQSGQGVTTHQLLVDGPAARDSDGNVTVRFTYPATNAPMQYYDPSIADLWAISAEDRIAPSVSAETGDDPPLGENGWHIGPVTVRLEAADDREPAPAIEYRLGGDWMPYSTPVTIATEGKTAFGYRARDAAANETTALTLPVWVDTRSPEVSISGGPTTTIAASDVTSGVAAIQYRLGVSGPWQPYGGPVALDAEHPLIQARAFDVAGNASAPVEYQLQDSVAPSSTANAALFDGNRVAVDWRATDAAGSSGLGRVDLYVRVPGASDFAKVATDTTGAASGRFVYVPEADGEYAFYTVASDQAGNVEAVPATVDTTVTVLLPMQRSADVTGTVPATLSLTLGTAARFGTFLPGVEREYNASTTATVISTAGNATLSVADPGHLTNGAFALSEPLQVDISKSMWASPVSQEPVAITFRQRIGSTEPLRTGTYSKALTYTLSTTSP